MLLESTRTHPRFRLARFRIACFAIGFCELCLAQSGNVASAMLPLSPAYVQVRDEIARTMTATTVEWEGRELDALEGTSVLMQIITDPATNATTRTKGLERLGRLRHREGTAQLVALFGSLATTQERLEILRCLISSADSRAFPLFSRVLERESDNTVRVYAAVALAQWNVRTGVAELLRLLEECRNTASMDSLICNEAAKEFLWLNTRKGWGFREEATRKAITERTELDDKAKAVLFVSEMKAWWTQNEHRFPDWKPGDPLPANEPVSDVPSAEQKPE